MSQENPLQTSIWSSEDFPARTSAWPEVAAAWMEANLDRDSGSSSLELYQNCGPELRSSKMSLVYLAATEAETLEPSFEGWQNSGICRPGECWTLSTSESHSGAVESSLWQVLETAPAPKYYLSARACAGILRRAEKRGRELPENLRQALEAVNR